MYTQPYLQKYKGKSTRHICPECGTKESFTLYYDGNTHQPINKKVGKCNRESKCGYHYTPKQYFIDNPTTSTDVACNVSNNLVPFVVKQQSFQPIGTIPFSYVERSASYKSNFVRFLCEILTNEQISSIGDKYSLGATKTAEVIFWQIDINGKVRTGKIMQYDPQSGKRIKHESGAIDWVHNKLKKSGTLPEDYNLQQCFFGEHLLRLHPEATVCIVESEKSAIISASIFPDEIWLAAGNIHGLSVDKCKVLLGRNVILYPDLNAFEKWTEKANLFEKYIDITFKVSNLLESISTTKAKSKGLDIADYMIEELKTKTNEKQIQSRFTPELQSMIEENPILMLIIDRLELIEI